jgi:hypothetical protein
MMWAVFLGCITLVLNNIQYTGGSKGEAKKDETPSEDDSPDSPENVATADGQLTFPFQRVDITFKDLRYTVKASTTGEQLELLKGISGYIESGKMTALVSFRISGLFLK